MPRICGFVVRVVSDVRVYVVPARGFCEPTSYSSSCRTASLLVTVGWTGLVLFLETFGASLLLLLLLRVDVF